MLRRGQPFYYLLVPTSSTANSCFLSGQNSRSASTLHSNILLFHSFSYSHSSSGSPFLFFSFSFPCFLFPCFPFILVLHPPRPKDRLDLWHLIHIFLSSLYFVINTNLQISTPYFPSFYYSFAHVCPFPLLPIWWSDASDCSPILCSSTHTCNN